MIWSSLVGKGDLVCSVSGEIVVDLSWAVAGEGIIVEVDHSADALDQDDTLLAKFALAEFPRFDGIGGVVIRPVLDGTDGDKFRIEIERLADPEYVYGYDEYETVYPGLTTGPVTLAWTRWGVLASGAEGA